jgi:hypothetical protein
MQAANIISVLRTAAEQRPQTSIPQTMDLDVRGTSLASSVKALPNALRWILKPVAGVANTYNIIVAGGRDASCGTYLSTGSQCTDTYVDLYTSDDGSGMCALLFVFFTL